MLSRGRLLIAGAVLVLGAAGLALRARKPEVRYLTAPATRGDVVDVVGATGTLEAVTTVQVGSQVSGTIQSLHADFNSVVKKGQVVARLDPSLFEARLGQARANLIVARANVDRSRAGVEDARQKFARARELSAQDLLPASDLETAKANHEAAVAQLKASEAGVNQAAASVKQAEVDLAHTVIEAPIDGIVIARSVDIGQTVAASFQAPILFAIANDLQRMQVNASIDEADIGRVRPGQEVTFRVDAYPERTFAGKLEQVRLQPTTAQNVVTYNTIISVDNPDQRLMPGMTATVSVEVQRADDVVRVGSTALRFRPEGFEEARSGSGPRPGRTGTAAPEAGNREGESRADPGEGGARSRGEGGRRRRDAPADASGDAAGHAAGTNGDRARGGRPGLVFVLGPDGTPEPRRVRLGISDGQYVEVLEGLEEGAPVITGPDGNGARPSAGPRPGGSPTTNPFSPQRPQRRQR